MATVTLDQLTKKYPNGFVAVSELDIGIADGEFLGKLYRWLQVS